MPKYKPDCLVIPDIHQHIAWADAIISKESDRVGKVVFLGDYFDAKLPYAASAEQTAGFVSSLVEAHPTLEFTFLVGNHDLPYLYGLQNPGAIFNPYTNGAFDETLLPGLSRSLSPSFTAKLEPFALIQGFLLSHAGLHRSFLPEGTIEESDLETLYTQLKSQLSCLTSSPDPALAAIGYSRGGISPVGGITWQDWNHEFEDSLPWPQLVGHTILEAPNQNNRSWNLDTRSGNYAIISEGTTSILSIEK